MKQPHIIKRILFYVLTLAHTPWTIVRVFVALIAKLDLWCDQQIYGYINQVDREIKEESEQN